MNKGKAALSIIEHNHYDFIIAFGDDYTDEDTFKALPESAITVKIGGNMSSAKFYLRSPWEVRRFLHSLAESGVVHQK